MPSRDILNFLTSLGGPLALVGFVVFLLTGLLKIALERIPTVRESDAAKLLRTIVTFVFILAIVIMVLGFVAYVMPQLIQGLRIAKMGTGTRREFRTSFELYGEPGSIESNAFVATDTTFAPYIPINAEFTVPKRSPLAHTGRYSLNFIPGGNPVVKPTSVPYATGVTVAVSALVLDLWFDVSGSQELTLAYFVNSTSNPRPANVHNCDSSLNIFVKRDDRDWAHVSAQCGQAKIENRGWQEVRLAIPADRAATMKLGFVYTLQNNNRPDPTAAYLIDDLDVRVTEPRISSK